MYLYVCKEHDVEHIANTFRYLVVPGAQFLSKYPSKLLYSTDPVSAFNSRHHCVFAPPANTVILPRPSSSVVTVLLHGGYTIVTLLLHCRHTVVRLLLKMGKHNSHSAKATVCSQQHYCYTIVRLLLNRCHTVITQNISMKK
jgi:hypothetical protein